MEKIYGITNENLGVFLDPKFLPHSAGKREETIKILEELQTQEETRKIITIDGTGFSSNIEIITDKNFEQTPLLLPSGIDGVILNTSKKARLILPVADCAPIIAYHKSGNIHGNFHAGYKGVAGEQAGDLGIITTMIESLKEISNTDNLDDFEFYIGPMIGREFELPKKYVDRLFGRIFKEYNLKAERYFLKHKNDDSKIYLHLRMLIRDILEKLGKKIRLKTYLKEEGSFFDNGITDNWNSEYPSHRLFAKFLFNEKNKSLLYEELNNFNLYLNSYLPGDKSVLSIKDEIKEINRKMKNKKFELYQQDYRLAVILDN